jgi:uncharacterized protein (DUF4415 family)
MKENGIKYGSDLERAFAREITPEEFEEIPELTEEMLSRAVWKRNGKVMGRPPAAIVKERITIRVSPEVSRYFRATGKGWQTRMDNALREWIDAHPQP